MARHYPTVAIEGNTGSGKTTILQGLSLLPQYDVVLVRAVRVQMTF